MVINFNGRKQFFDDLELRSETQRNQDHLTQLIKLIQKQKKIESVVKT